MRHSFMSLTFVEKQKSSTQSLLFILTQLFFPSFYIASDSACQFILKSIFQVLILTWWRYQCPNFWWNAFPIKQTWLSLICLNIQELSSLWYLSVTGAASYRINIGSTMLDLNCWQCQCLRIPHRSYHQSVWASFSIVVRIRVYGGGWREFRHDDDGESP